MNKLFASILLAAIPSLAAAEAPASHRFTRDGQTYVYTSTMKHARQVIDGYSIETGGRFHLVVRDNAVSGESDGREVSFHLPVARSTSIETAQR